MKHTRTIVIIAYLVALLAAPLAMTGCEASQDRRDQVDALVEAFEGAEARIAMLEEIELPRLRVMLEAARADGSEATYQLMLSVVERTEMELERTRKLRDGSLAAVRLISENAVGDDGSVDAEALVNAIGVGVSTAFPAAAPFVAIGTVLVGIFGNLIGKKKGKQDGAKAQAQAVAPIVKSAHELVTGIQKWRDNADPEALAAFNKTVSENTGIMAKRFVRHSKGQIQDIQIARLEYGMPTVQ